MSKKLYEETNIENIGAAIREKNGSSDRYTTAQMPNAIRAITTQTQLQEKNISVNGEYTPDAGFDGFSKVTANVPNTYVAADEGKVVSNGALKSQTNTTVNQNGVVDTTEIKQLTVAVPSGSTGILIQKRITQNGTYIALDDSADGYDEVIVDVAGGSDTTGMVSPSYQGLAYCYVTRDGTAIEGTRNKAQFINVFEVIQSHNYIVALGSIVGSRRRATFLANKSFSDIDEYINQQQKEGASLITGGSWLAPFSQNSDDTGNSLSGRICFNAPKNGLFIYGTDNNGQNVPAYCFDIGVINSDTFVLHISRALRGSDQLNYAGAHEIRLIYTDQNGDEYDLSTLRADNVNPTDATKLFDDTFDQYYEKSPTPFDISFNVEVPSDKTYTLKRLEVYRRTGSLNTDVWSDFTLTQNGNLVIERSNLSVNDWAPAGSWTSFTVDS